MTARITFIFVVMTIVSLACAFTVSTPPVMTTTPEPTKTVVMTDTPKATSTEEWTATVERAQINVRDEPDGTVMTHLKSGDEVTIVRCLADWCKISNPVTGWVWRGCLSDNPKKLGCEAR